MYSSQLDEFVRCNILLLKIRLPSSYSFHPHQFLRALKRFLRHCGTVHARFHNFVAGSTLSQSKMRCDGNSDLTISLT